MPKLLNNSESWLGLNNIHIEKLNDFQNNFLRKVFQVSPSGTPRHAGARWANAINGLKDSREETEGAREDVGKDEYKY